MWGATAGDNLIAFTADTGDGSPTDTGSRCCAGSRRKASDEATWARWAGGWDAALRALGRDFRYCERCKCPED